MRTRWAGGRQYILTPEGWRPTTPDRWGELARTQRRPEPRRHRRPTRHPMLDGLVKVGLIFAWLICAATWAATVPVPVPILLAAWVALAFSMRWLWDQYRHQTSPTHDRPAVTRTPGLPILVRLCLLPGAARIFGQPAVTKARRIRSLRRARAAGSWSWARTGWDTELPATELKLILRAHRVPAFEAGWDCDHSGHRMSNVSNRCLECRATIS